MQQVPPIPHRSNRLNISSGHGYAVCERYHSQASGSPSSVQRRLKHKPLISLNHLKSCSERTIETIQHDRAPVRQPVVGNQIVILFDGVFRTLIVMTPKILSHSAPDSLVTSYGIRPSLPRLSAVKNFPARSCGLFYGQSLRPSASRLLADDKSS